MTKNLKHFSLAAVTLAMLNCVAADWPQFRGPSANGIAPDKGINKDWKAKPPKELWSIDLGDKGFAGPSIAKGKLFIIDHAGADDVIRAVDVTTGKDVWTFKYADTDKDNYGFSRSTPVYDNGKLYTISRTGILHCLDAEKGAKIWSHDLRKEYHGLTGNWDYAWSPLVDGQKLIVQPGGAKGVIALDKDTGKEIWSGGGPEACGYATAVSATINGKKEYVIFTGDALIGIDADKGGPALWRCPWKTAYGVNAATPIVIGDSVFITSGYDTGCALVAVQGAEAKPAWVNKEIKAHFNTPVLFNGKIFGIGDGAGLVYLDPKTGTAAWRQAGFEKGGLVAVDDVLIAINGAEGDVVMAAADPSAYKELGRFKPLGGRSWTAPVIADGKLFVRNNLKLACYDLK
jgi:outer membrane protein assembly factor BamB